MARKKIVFEVEVDDAEFATNKANLMRRIADALVASCVACKEALRGHKTNKIAAVRGTVSVTVKG